MWRARRLGPLAFVQPGITLTFSPVWGIVYLPGETFQVPRIRGHTG